MRGGGAWERYSLVKFNLFINMLVREGRGCSLVMFVVLARTMGRDAVKDGRVEEG